MEETNIAIVNVRDAAALTTSYVPGTVIGLAQPVEAAHRFNNITLCYSFTKATSTSMEIKMEVAKELLYAVAYDGQSANFTAGKILTGATSGAKATIVQDTDGGATGTLIVRFIDWGRNGTGFIDNEAITDDNSTPGVAVVNASVNPNTATPDDLSFYQETAESVSAGTGTIRELEKTVVSANQSAATQRYETVLTTKAPYIRLSFKCTGTATSTVASAFAILGNI